jgi:drug/metabolite transporter superfamily protein YnfA
MPIATVSATSITVNGSGVDSESASAPIPLAEGNNILTITVTAEDGLGTQSYSLYVARATAADFAQQAFLKASNAGEKGYFGYSVELDGDTLVVAAQGEDSTVPGAVDNTDAEDSGAVYVFTHSDGNWTQQAFLKASNAETYDHFGSSVALDGDTLVVGAQGEDSTLPGGESNNEASGAGAVYVFTRSNGIWSQQAFLKASNAGANDSFGVNVALAGNTLVIAAMGEASTLLGGESNNDASYAGAVYVFARSNGSWTQQAFLKASTVDQYDNFGASIALDGNTLVVGANGEDSTAAGGENNNGDSEAGAVYVFTHSNGSWSQQDFLKASNAEAGDYFGGSVAMDSDTLVVGVRGEDSTAAGGESNNDATDSGAVYVFTLSNGHWSQQDLLKASTADTHDYFGASVAVNGDSLVVGASGEGSTAAGGDNNDADTAGAVYTFSRSNGIWTQQDFLKASNAQASDYFGGSVALDGDTLVVGAIGESSTAAGGESNNDVDKAGAVYVWQ